MASLATDTRPAVVSSVHVAPVMLPSLAYTLLPLNTAMRGPFVGSLANRYLAGPGGPFGCPGPVHAALLGHDTNFNGLGTRQGKPGATELDESEDVKEAPCSHRTLLLRVFAEMSANGTRRRVGD